MKFHVTETDIILSYIFFPFFHLFVSKGSCHDLKEELITLFHISALNFYELKYGFYSEHVE